MELWITRISMIRSPPRSTFTKHGTKPSERRTLRQPSPCTLLTHPLKVRSLFSFWGSNAASARGTTSCAALSVWFSSDSRRSASAIAPDSLPMEPNSCGSIIGDARGRTDGFCGGDGVEGRPDSSPSGVLGLVWALNLDKESTLTIISCAWQLGPAGQLEEEWPCQNRS